MCRLRITLSRKVGGHRLPLFRVIQIKIVTAKSYFLFAWKRLFLEKMFKSYWISLVKDDSSSLSRTSESLSVSLSFGAKS